MLQLGKHKEALEFAICAQSLAPSGTEAAEKVENLKRHITAGQWLYYCYSIQVLLSEIYSYCSTKQMEKAQFYYYSLIKEL